MRTFAPLPRKGTETPPLAYSRYIQSGLFFRSITPQGDGNKKASAPNIGIIKAFAPLPRKGTETFISVLEHILAPKPWAFAPLPRKGTETQQTKIDIPNLNDLSLHYPARGRKQEEGVQLELAVEDFRSITPQGDGNLRG